MCILCIEFKCILTYNNDSGEGSFCNAAHIKKKGVRNMPIKYRIDVLDALKAAGYSTYKLRKEKLLGESVIQQIRENDLVSWGNMSRLCALLGCQPGDILEYDKEGTEKE